jgi:hypothetical protein
MHEHLIEPLRQQYTTPEFYNHINRAEAWLRKGLLGGIRQLEVVLIWCGKVNRQIQTLAMVPTD